MDESVSQEFRAAAAYAEAVFDVEAPDGLVTLRVGRPAIELPASLLHRRLAVVTAYNPGDARPAEDVNRHANEQLRAAIDAEGWRWYPSVGRSVSGDHAEPSCAVLDITEEQARDLGARFGQACVFFWDGVAGALVWCA